MQGLIYIWSKDRAMQLEALLHSMKNTYLLEEFDIEILYKYSDPYFRNGYEMLRHDYDIKWTVQDDAKEQFISSAKQYKYICICTDDTWIHRQPDCTILDKMDDISVFSLRLGLNTIVQNHFTNEYQPILKNYQDEGKTISWNFSSIHPYFNYGYPFSMDMHVYKSEELVPLLEQIQFSRPPELEGNLLQFRSSISQRMRSFRESCAVNIPLNCMSGNTQSINKSLSDMNHMFLQEYRLRYNSDIIIGCHQNVGYTIG